MGKLVYGDGEFGVALDDHVLAHLQIVIGAKLRRQEAFYFSWVSDAGTRSSIWLQQAIPLRYEYAEATPQTINREWLESLSVSANGANGLSITEEPLPPAAPSKVTPTAKSARASS